MKYRDFGKTGLKVSEVGFGAWAIGGNEHGNSYGDTDDKISTAAIHKTIDLGCNFFDTADVYGFGHSEELIGRACKGKRDRLIIATKVGGDFYQGARHQTFTPEYIRFALEKTMARLRTDYVDVYQLHNPPLRLINQESLYEVIKELKKEGKVRAWGVSIFDPVEGLTALKLGQPDCLQVPYNIFNAKPKDQLFAKAQAQGTAIIAREPLANGFLTGKYNPDTIFQSGDIRCTWPKDHIQSRILAQAKLQFLVKANKRTFVQSALRYVLDNDAVSVVIVGIKTPSQAQENMDSSKSPPLTAEEMSRVAELQKYSFMLPQKRCFM